MKNYLLLIIYFSLTLSLKAQTPESGWFWSLRKQQLDRDTAGKFSGMGWEEVPTGKYAFEFSDSLVTVYKDGFMGKEYKSKDTYPVIKRGRISENEEGFSVYEYVVTQKSLSLRFIVRVSNNDYNIALVSIFDNPVDDKFMRLTAYGCSRHYK
jgi:hypothetical protein